MIKRLLLFLLAGIVCFGIMLVLFDQVIMPKVVRHGQEVEVPDVTEKTLEEATSILQSKGLVLSLERWQQTEDVPKGEIISQRPEPFSRAKPGRHIYVVVSKGGKLHRVPDVRGISPREAKLVIEQHGLKLGEIRREPSEESEKGTVIAQVPPPDTLVSGAILVNIVVGTGPEQKRILMPDLVGKGLEEALSILKEMNLKPGLINYQPDTTYLPDTVLDQSVKPGEIVQEGEKVDLVVSKP